MRMLNVLKRHSFFWIATLVIMAIVMLIGAALINNTDRQYSINTFFHSHKNIFVVWRLSIYFLLITAWPSIVAFIGKHKVELSIRRSPIVLLVCIYELVIVQNPLAWVLTLLLE